MCHGLNQDVRTDVLVKGMFARLYISVMRELGNPPALEAGEAACDPRITDQNHRSKISRSSN